MAQTPDQKSLTNSTIEKGGVTGAPHGVFLEFILFNKTNHQKEKAQWVH